MHQLILEFKEALLSWLDDYKTDILHAVNSAASDIDTLLRWADDDNQQEQEQEE